MRSVRTLKPGRFGPSLVLVRHRCDEDRREHLKTVELVVQRRQQERKAELPGSPAPGVRATKAATRRLAPRIGCERGICSGG